MNILEISKKIKEMIKIISEGWEDFRGLKFIDDNVIIAYGYTGMGSTTSTRIVSKDILLNGNVQDLINNSKYYERPNPTWNYIEIENDKVYKYCQGIGKICEITKIEDFDF